MQKIVTVEENCIKLFSLKEEKLIETYPNTENIVQLVANTKSNNYIALIGNKTIKVSHSTSKS